MDDPGRRAENSPAAGPQQPAGPESRSPCRDRDETGGMGSHPAHLSHPSHLSHASLSRVVQERDQLRLILQMVLDVRVYDGAGRSLTVQNALRGHLATRVRMVLDAKRMEHEPGPD
jgi:hypothetical protein